MMIYKISSSICCSCKSILRIRGEPVGEAGGVGVAEFVGGICCNQSGPSLSRLTLDCSG